MEIIILGCSPSLGVPRVGNNWGKCDPLNPKNKRTRSSVLVNTQGKNILIDTSPDLYHQLIRENISSIDAVLWTHYHADHSHGIGDLVGTSNKPIICYADQTTYCEITKAFSYCFKSIFNQEPFCKLNVINFSYDEILGPFYFSDIKIVPIFQNHGKINSVGFRIGNFAYNVDFNYISPANIDLLKGVELWVTESACNNHFSHNSLEGMLEIHKIFNPKKTVLVNLDIDLDYNEFKDSLPENIEPAYDGMRLKL